MGTGAGDGIRSRDPQISYPTIMSLTLLYWCEQHANHQLEGMCPEVIFRGWCSNQAELSGR
jgi:hypothetical protein